MPRRVRAVDSVLADREVVPGKMWTISFRDFIRHKQRHVVMEDRDFFPAALNAFCEPQDWTEIASALTSHEDPLFSEAAEETGQGRSDTPSNLRL